MKDYMTPVCNQTAMRYVDICCRSLSAEEFKQILDPQVILWHQTNQGKPIVAEGIEVVSTLFKKYIFDNTSHIKMQTYSFMNFANSIQLTLEIEEDKLKNDKHKHYHFKEITDFKFSHNGSKISSINTIVERTKI